ncbi:MAG: 1,4-dihydroxy-2-naphthoate polyprenyltransferase [Candidatus Promineifilaceae bacterium]
MSDKSNSGGMAVWLDAMRPRTLPLATASILMGSALAASRPPFSWAVTILAIITAILLQILSNLANDYGDSQHGADSAHREGPQRAVQSGAISSRKMLAAIVITSLLSAIIGIALLWAAFGSQGIRFILVFLLLGGAAILAAIGYTAGIRPYGYAGLGDLSVLIFFGWVAVMGTYFLQTERLDWDVMLPATSCGLLAVAVLNINNIRDRRSDGLAGKNTIPVRLGLQGARIYHWILLLGAILLAIIYVLNFYYSPWQFLFLLTVPLLIANGIQVWRMSAPAELNPLLKKLSITTLLFVLVFSIGQVL